MDDKNKNIRKNKKYLEKVFGGLKRLALHSRKVQNTNTKNPSFRIP